MKLLKFGIVFIFFLLAIFFFIQGKWIEATISLLFAFINHIWMDLDKLTKKIRELELKLSDLNNKIDNPE